MVTKTPFPQTSSIGSAGEHLVLSQLLKMNFVAGLAPENTKDYDLIVLNREGNVSFPIQVKTALHTKTTNTSSGWILRDKHEKPIKDLIFCFVRMNLDSRESDIYIVDSEKVAECCKYSHQIWLKFPSMKGDKHKDTSMRMFSHDFGKIRTKKLSNWKDYLNDKEINFIETHPEGWLEKYKEAWHLIKA